jgi:hypothetical protein
MPDKAGLTMNDQNSCSNCASVDEVMHCRICDKPLDYLTASVSEDINDAIYVCMGSLKQRIFVYGKYIGGRYGALTYESRYKKEECNCDRCNEALAAMLTEKSEEEYSRLITCRKGEMKAILVTKRLVVLRKDDLTRGRLVSMVPSYTNSSKYYCHDHASHAGYTCECGERLIHLGSEEYRELTGMDDQDFMERYLHDVLSV